MKTRNNLLTVEVDQEINSKNKITRESIKNIMNDSLFTPIFDIHIRKQKELALERLKRVVSKKFFSVKDFRSNPENIFTMHEMLGFIDGSLATKFTVQFNLFGGTIIGLGSEKHEEVINKLDTLEIIGCFCLTELGYGNNAVEMESTAVWDESKKRFIINTPTVNSHKFWITNGAYHANYSIVFAQTIVKGKNEGINAFLVKLRNNDGSLEKGVIIDDMGHKMGLNGIDNARVILKNIEADSNSLLDRISQINPETGEFKSMIKGRRARFIYAANRLLSGRLCIASMMISCSKVGLINTIKYAKSRLSNGKTGKSDTPIFNYQLFQNQITPLLANTLIYNVALHDIRAKYCHYILNEKSYTQTQINEIIRLCCFIKPMISWNTNTIGNVARERCGGQGYLSINLVEAAIYSSHSGITAEGDSAVLMQKVAKEYVEDFSKGEIDIPYDDFSDDSVKQKYNSLNSLINEDLKELLLEINSSKIQSDKLLKFSGEIHKLNLLLIELHKVRESSLLSQLTEKTVTKPNEIYDTWMLKESDLIQNLSFIYGKRYCFESFLNSQLYKNEGKCVEKE